MSGLIANRYAKAWFSYMQDHLENAIQDANLIMETLKYQTLQEVLFNPLIKGEIKKNILEDLFKNKIHSNSFDFILLLLKKKRFPLVLACCEKLIHLQQDKEGIRRVLIKTAHPLSSPQQEKITQKIQNYFSKISVSYQIDSWLIGGLVLQVEGQQLDQSVRTQLKNIHYRLTKI